MRSAKNREAESLPVNASLEGLIYASRGTLAKWNMYNQGCMDGVSESLRVNTALDALTDR